jgi:hypothetical protein
VIVALATIKGIASSWSIHPRPPTPKTPHLDTRCWVQIKDPTKIIPLNRLVQPKQTTEPKDELLDLSLRWHILNLHDLMGFLWSFIITFCEVITTDLISMFVQLQ